MRDAVMEYARAVTIPLQYGVGQYVRLQLEFDSKWMMISEVQFRSGRWRLSTIYTEFAWFPALRFRSSVSVSATVSVKTMSVLPFCKCQPPSKRRTHRRRESNLVHL